MGIIQKQSIINSIIIYIGIALGFISTIYLYPNILAPEEYGLTRLLLSIGFVFAQFAHLGMKNIAIKFFPYFENPAKGHNGFLFLSLFIPLMGFIVFLGILFFFNDFIINYYQNKSALFTSYYWFLAPLVFGILYFEVINSYVRARLHSVPGSVISEIILRAVAIILLILFFFGTIDFRYFMTGFVASYILQPLLLLLFLFFKGELNLRPNFAYLKSTLVKRMGNYGLFSVLGGMTTLIVNNIDIIMLGSLSGLSETGVYAIAFYIGSVIIVPQKAIAKIAPSLIAKQLKEKLYDEVEHIYKSSSINQLVPGFLIFIGIVANMDNILEILPDEYSAVSSVIIIIGLSKLINMAAGLNGVIILNSRYYRFDLISMVFLVLFSIGLNYWLIPLHGIAGAAMATAVSLLIYNLIKGIYVWIKFSMQPLSPKVIIVILLSALILFGSLQVDRIGSLYVDIAVRSLLITTLYSTGIIVFNVSEEVNKIWSDLKNKIR